MNRLKYIGIALIAAGMSLTSCNDYLDVQLNDQMTLQEVFNKRNTTLNYLSAVYSYLPKEAEYLGANGGADINYGGDGFATSISDDANFGWTQWVTYLNIRTGDFGPTYGWFNNWSYMYKGIEQASIFMENVMSCPDMPRSEKVQALAEARFIRAYNYFQLFRRFGPVFIWGDRRADQTIKPDEIDRNTVDENIDFIVSEIDKACEDLPLVPEDMTASASRVTKGAAMAAKARILLYAASPLFNGCDLYKGKLMNKDGNYLFPQQVDPQKWEKAAKAAKDVIDLGLYSLYVDNTVTDPFLKAIKSYQGVQFEPWNSEIIWGYWPRYSATYYNIPCFNKQRMIPHTLCQGAVGGFCPSLKLVDSYPMAATGRYPVKGYEGGDYNKPIVDEQSGYQYEGFTNAWIHPIEGEKYGAVKAHNSCVGRDARYYASVFANGFHWINEYTASGKSDIITYYTGGTCGLTAETSDRCGFQWRRWLDSGNNYHKGEYGNYFYFYFRLAEVYLNYAEACNEKPNRDAEEALKYVNLIRERAGLNTLQEAYPEINFAADKEQLRYLIRKERQVELAFENHRYYDCRRWMTAVDEFNTPNWSLNLNSTNYELSWERVTNVWQGSNPKFELKNYFFPIYQAQLSEMKNITQNYGW